MNKNMKKNCCVITCLMLVVVVVCLVINKYRNENMENQNVMGNVAQAVDLAATVHQPTQPPEDDEGDSSEEKFTEHASTDCMPKETLTPEELLPQDTGANAWSLSQPQGSGSLKDKNFLQAGYNIGINTVGQTLRNANMQLRSDPPNPQVAVSPWQQSTINADTNRKPFEIGGCA